jgi:hypothetical protein
MTIRVGARIAALLLSLHGLIEIAGPIALAFNPRVQTGSGFEGGPFGLALLGAVWGLTHLAAGWGIWHRRKWALMLGVLMSAITMAAAVDILPTGLGDTVLAAPVLALSLYLWFRSEKVGE